MSFAGLLKDVDVSITSAVNPIKGTWKIEALDVVYQAQANGVIKLLIHPKTSEAADGNLSVVNNFQNMEVLENPIDDNEDIRPRIKRPRTETGNLPPAQARKTNNNNNETMNNLNSNRTNNTTNNLNSYRTNNTTNNMNSSKTNSTLMNNLNSLNNNRTNNTTNNMDSNRTINTTNNINNSTADNNLLNNGSNTVLQRAVAQRLGLNPETNNFVPRYKELTKPAVIPGDPTPSTGSKNLVVQPNQNISAAAARLGIQNSNDNSGLSSNNQIGNLLARAALIAQEKNKFNQQMFNNSNSNEDNSYGTQEEGDRDGYIKQELAKLALRLKESQENDNNISDRSVDTRAASAFTQFLQKNQQQTQLNNLKNNLNNLNNSVLGSNLQQAIQRTTNNLKNVNVGNNFNVNNTTNNINEVEISRKLFREETNIRRERDEDVIRQRAAEQEAERKNMDELLAIQLDKERRDMEEAKLKKDQDFKAEQKASAAVAAEVAKQSVLKTDCNKPGFENPALADATKLKDELLRRQSTETLKGKQEQLKMMKAHKDKEEQLLKDKAQKAHIEKEKAELKKKASAKKIADAAKAKEDAAKAKEDAAKAKEDAAKAKEDAAKAKEDPPKRKSSASKVEEVSQIRAPPAVPSKNPKKANCNIKDCSITAQFKITDSDSFGNAGWRCERHQGKQLCWVDGCTLIPRRQIKKKDDHGRPGFRCDKHGGGVNCTSLKCNTAAVIKVGLKDKHGAAGWRCLKHSSEKQQLCNVKTCKSKSVYALERSDKVGEQGGRCLKHYGTEKKLNANLEASLLP